MNVSSAEFVSFAQQTDPLPKSGAGLTGEIATRRAAGDLSSYFGLLPNPDPVLRAMGKSIEVYRNLLPDPLVLGARARRNGAVLAMERGYDLELSKRTPVRVLKECEAMLADMDVRRIIEDQIDGAFFGYRVSELMWGQSTGGPKPLDLVAKPSEWFAFDPEGSKLKFRPKSQATGVDVPDRKFVVVGKRRNWENPYGEPDLAACFWPVTFKRAGFKFWMTFGEKYGMPWVVGKQPRGTPQPDTDALADKLQAMVRDAVAVIPEDDSVEFLTVAGSANADMYERFLMFCRSEISIALLGNNQSVEMQSNKASAEAAHEVEGFVRDADAQMIASAFNQMTRNFCEVRYPGVAAPVYAFWEQEEVDDVLASRDQKLKNAGANFTNAYWMRTYKLEAGDLMPETRPQDSRAPAMPDAAKDQASFAEPNMDDVPADQAALDAAINQLPADAIQAAMKTMLAPALAAIAKAATADEVRQALLDAWPDMDTTALEELMGQAYFVADLIGEDSAGVAGAP